MKIENNKEWEAAIDRMFELIMAPEGTPEWEEYIGLSAATTDYHATLARPREDIYRQALDEAILGLHGMNKDFPNETWESRQAYLDATIAGINDTLSLLK